MEERLLLVAEDHPKSKEGEGEIGMLLESPTCIVLRRFFSMLPCKGLKLSPPESLEEQHFQRLWDYNSTPFYRQSHGHFSFLQFICCSIPYQNQKGKAKLQEKQEEFHRIYMYFPVIREDVNLFLRSFFIVVLVP